ncbi:hypothetical protein RHGRI_026889 [Rhododendron griersonianum]|uniref:Aspergillus nuclease S1 n=1 Tax=Rhododendron griersonianum TaxID=479676 RepID=A0AAV6IWR6_9ERIC|nr:hypothetical protein RHGRI_026889 [Rhododendron griersonianum]
MLPISSNSKKTPLARIAQSRLSEAAAAAVNALLPESANGDLGSECSWADDVQYRYPWSPPLHFINTPDGLCSYDYNRDCMDENGVMDRCSAGAINNYTSQLLTYGTSSSQYNLTDALLFLSYFMGDIHQPLHTGFTSDLGGNTIDIYWYDTKTVLHHAWDTNVIETAETTLFNSTPEGLIAAIQANITSRLSEAAADAVKKLLPESAEGDLGSECSWADRVKFRYHWSSALHYIDTPDDLCTFQYNSQYLIPLVSPLLPSSRAVATKMRIIFGDCKDEDGVMDRCVAGAINNYTGQLLTYGNAPSEYNLTEALLFLSHFMGDIHQPLHVGFTSDRGGNTIDIHWYRTKTVLHHVWDTSMIETSETRSYDSHPDGLIAAIQANITGEWADQVKAWETCGSNVTTCPNTYDSY